jgi:hypothetical protein
MVTRQAETCVTTRPLNPNLCAGTCRNYEPLSSKVQHLYNEALVAQRTMKHVPRIAQQHSHSIRKVRGRQVARVELLILITPLWHDAEKTRSQHCLGTETERERGPENSCGVRRAAFRFIRARTIPAHTFGIYFSYICISCSLECTTSGM